MSRDEIAARVLGIVEDFIKTQEIASAETIWQTDWVIENAYKLIEDLCEVVGYYDYGDVYEDE